MRTSRARFWIAAAIATAAGVVSGTTLVACNTASPTGNTGTTPPAATAQQVSMTVFRGENGITGPDGNHHDTIAPSSLVVRAGTPVELTTQNFDEGPHTLTIDQNGTDVTSDPGVGFTSLAINAGSGTDSNPHTDKFTFTPSKPGVYHWHCEVMCDGGGHNWAMTPDATGSTNLPDRNGFMAGEIIVEQASGDAPPAP